MSEQHRVQRKPIEEAFLEGSEEPFYHAFLGETAREFRPYDPARRSEEGKYTIFNNSLNDADQTSENPYSGEHADQTSENPCSGENADQTSENLYGDKHEDPDHTSANPYSDEHAYHALGYPFSDQHADHILKNSRSDEFNLDACTSDDNSARFDEIKNLLNKMENRPFRVTDGERSRWECNPRIVAQDATTLQPEPLKISTVGSVDKGDAASVCSMKSFLHKSRPCHSDPLEVPNSPLGAKAKELRHKKSIKDIGRLFSTPKSNRIRPATVGGSPVSPSYATPTHAGLQSQSLPVTPVRPRHRPLIVPTITTETDQQGQSVEEFPPLVNWLSSDSTELPRESSIRRRLNSIPRKISSMIRKKA
ncbi:MAG: hypothetical protein Q9167_006735 [Letrouitia subvulpina]